MHHLLIYLFADAEFTSLKAFWEKARFRLRLLEGHNDIVTSVVAVDNLVVSGRYSCIIEKKSDNLT